MHPNQRASTAALSGGVERRRGTTRSSAMASGLRATSRLLLAGNCFLHDVRSWPGLFLRADFIAAAAKKISIGWKAGWGRAQRSVTIGYIRVAITLKISMKHSYPNCYRRSKTPGNQSTHSKRGKQSKQRKKSKRCKQRKQRKQRKRSTGSKARKQPTQAKEAKQAKEIREAKACKQCSLFLSVTPSHY